VDITDEAGKIVARVVKTLYIRKKKEGHQVVVPEWGDSLEIE